MAGEFRFHYSGFGLCLGFALILSMGALVVWGLTVGDQKIGALLLAAACAPGAIAWLRMPVVFRISDGRITICNMWGRRQSWLLTDVIVRNADRPFFRNTIAQETIVTDSSGDVLFRLYPFRGLNQLVELLAPGSSAAARRAAPGSRR